LNGLNKTHTNH